MMQKEIKMKTFKNTSRSVVCTAALFAWAIPAMAQTQWQGSPGVPGNWTDTANWVGGSLPTADARIENGGIAVIDTSPVSSTYVRANPGTLRIGASGSLVADGAVSVGVQTGRTALLEVNGGSLTATNTATARGLILGDGAGSTGTVAVADGVVTLGSLRVGWNGAGVLAISNGVVAAKGSSTYNSNVGGNAGATGEIVQSGGVFRFTGIPLVLGYNGGGKGRYALSGGSADIPFEIYVGYSTGGIGGIGELEVTGGTLTNGVVVASRAGATGSAVFTDTTQTLNQLRVNTNGGAGMGTAVANSTAFVTFNNSIITNRVQSGTAMPAGYGAGSSATFLQNGGRTFWNIADISLGYTAGATGTYTVTNNGVLESGLALGEAGDGRLNIHGGTVSTRLGTLTLGSSGTGTVEMTSGSLTVSGLSMPAAGGTGTFLLKGGTLKSAYRLNRSHLFYVGGKDPGMGPGYLLQSGGSLLVDTNAAAFNLGRGLYEISGGELNSPDYPMSIRNLAMPDVPVFRVKGSAPTVAIRNFNAGSSKTYPFLLQFVLDKSPEHLANVDFTASDAYRCGHLRVGLDGGVVLSQANSFALLKWGSLSTSAANGDYLSRPDADMWTSTLKTTSPAEDRITLADGYKQADLDVRGTTRASFAARAMGHVTVANVRTNGLVELHARLAVTPGDKTLEQLAADLVAAGYTNSVVESSGPYNLRVAIPPDCVVDKSVQSPSYFIWDFTDPTTLATNATVTAVSMEVVRETPPTLVVIR